jgi:hypothetical protein
MPSYFLNYHCRVLVIVLRARQKRLHMIFMRYTTANYLSGTSVAMIYKREFIR